MPDSNRGFGRLSRSVLATAIAVVTSLLGAPSALAADTVGGVDIDATVALLDGDHVAVLGNVGSTDADLAAPIAQARGGHIALSIVVAGDGVIQGDQKAVADAVRAEVHGTVLVVGPAGVALSSDSVGEAEAADAVAAGNAGSDPVDRAAAVVDSLTGETFPWSLLIIAGIAILALGGLAGGLWERYRRRRDNSEAWQDLAAGLAARVDALEPEVRGLSARAASTGRQDIDDRCDQVTADHAELRETLSRPLESRRAVDRCAHDVNVLTERLTDLEGEIDSLLEQSARSAPDGQPPPDGSTGPGHRS